MPRRTFSSRPRARSIGDVGATKASNEESWRRLQGRTRQSRSPPGDANDVRRTNGRNYNRRHGGYDSRRRRSRSKDRYSDSDEDEEMDRRRLRVQGNRREVDSFEDRIGRRTSLQDELRFQPDRLATAGSQELDIEENANKSLFQLSREGDEKAVANLLSKIRQSKLPKLVNQLDSNKISALHYAARYDHFPIVKFLTQSGADVNIRGDDGLTPLHFCARYKIVDKSPLGVLQPLLPEKNLDIFRDGELGLNNILSNNNASEKMVRATVSKSVILYLAAQGARVNEKDKYGLTPLHYAAMRGNEDATKELLACEDIDIECKDEQLLTPLHLACTYGMVEVARILLEQGADILVSGEKKQTALHKAASVGNFTLVEMVTDAAHQVYGRKAIATLLQQADIDSNTPLMLAVESGSVEITKHLVELGANVNRCNKNRQYPLHLACIIGSVEIVKLLLHNKAIINSINNSYQTPLLVASAYNHVPVIEYLLKKGARIEKKDRDSFTPLLLAAAEGNADAVELLLQHGADIYALDRMDKSVLYWAAAQNHLETVNVLLKDPRSKRLLDSGDRYDNTPLHVSAERGLLTVVTALLDAEADVDNKNEDEQTPLHLAAKQGRTRICKEILRRDRFSVNDEDSDSNTALHLACMHGHARVVKILIGAGADIEARNYYLWTPIDCAAAHGRPICARLLLEANSPVDPMDKNKTTPLHLTARYGHEKTAALLIKHDASLTQTNSDGHNALTIAILHGKKDVANIILESDGWMSALKSQYISPITHVRETPLRLLIKQFPDLAKKAFDRCMKTNLQSDSKQKSKMNYTTVSADDPRFSITLNFELLDDMYCLFHDDDDKISIQMSMDDDNHSLASAGHQVAWADGEIWDDSDYLVPEAKTYSDSATVLKLNHPLMIMVKEQRTNLLGHPLCMALVRHKWNSFGRYVYYFTLALYFTFVIFLTDFIINTPAPYSPKQILEYSTYGNRTFEDAEVELTNLLKNHELDGFGSEEACLEIREIVDIQRRNLATLGKIIILVLAVFHLLKEGFQITQARLTYIGTENLIELLCYVTAILFVVDFTDCHKETGLRLDWQWQFGAVAITASWLNLLSNVRKFPFLGIYVVMFTDVFKTFLKFSLICCLFIIAFSLGFYALLAEQENFGNFGFSLIKTCVMMIGEFEFDDLFFDNPSADPDKTALILPYRTVTLLFFITFVCIMSIIVMNLLVGLAVDDIKLVQDNAVLQRLAMQVTLNLDVEKMLPQVIRRRFVIRKETVLPNERTSILSRVLHDDNTLKRIAKAVVAHGNETELQRMSIRVEDSSKEIRNMRESFGLITNEIELIKSLLARLARHHGMDYEEEDNEK